jgi:hypothetical protein
MTRDLRMVLAVQFNCDIYTSVVSICSNNEGIYVYICVCLYAFIHGCSSLIICMSPVASRVNRTIRYALYLCMITSHITQVYIRRHIEVSIDTLALIVHK